MRFIYGKPHFLFPHRWYVDTSTASASFIDECFVRGATEESATFFRHIRGESQENMERHRQRLLYMLRDKEPTPYIDAHGGGCFKFREILREVESDNFPP